MQHASPRKFVKHAAASRRACADTERHVLRLVASLLAQDTSPDAEASPRAFSRSVNIDLSGCPLATVDVIADARKMPFQDKSFDIVLAFGSIYGVRWSGDSFKLTVMPPDGLKEVVRILRKGSVARIGPISLLRSCWRKKEDVALYLESARPEIFSHLASLKSMFPDLWVSMYRNIDAENPTLFDEWLELQK